MWYVPLDAGEELADKGSTSNDLLQRVSQPLISEEDFRGRFNEA